MTKWEYLTCGWQSSYIIVRQDKRDALVQQLQNLLRGSEVKISKRGVVEIKFNDWFIEAADVRDALGELGWELVGYDASSSDTGWVFKRPVGK